MLKRFLVVMSFCVSTICFSQTENFSVSLENDDYFQAILKLEKLTDKHFYFAEDWLPEEKVTKNYENVSLVEVLEDLFKSTTTNYYILDSTIILTRNTIIYDKLPEGFSRYLDSEETHVTENAVEKTEVNNSPIFLRNNDKLDQEIETIFIGKEEIGQSKRNFRLSGYVYDKETNQPISDIAIVTENGKGISTDKEGFYDINLGPGINILSIRSLTNENISKRFVMYNDGQYSFYLSENLEQLDEVMLSSNMDSNIDDANTGEETIDVENIKNIPLVLGERDVLKVATLLPGISTPGEGSAGFNVRGGKADQNLMLLDDAVMYNPAHFFGLFAAINPFTTGNVTIFKGNIPAEYGGRLSSVFDITTKDSDTSEFRGEASLGLVTSNTTVEIPIEKGKSGLILGGRATYSNWILRSLDEESLSDSEASFYDGIVKYNHQFNPNSKLTATAYFSDDAFSITSDSLYGFQNRLFSIKYNTAISEKTRGEVILANSDYKFDINYDSNLEDRFELGYHINESEIKFNLNSNIYTNHKLNYGVSSKFYNVEPGYIKPIGDSNIINFEVNRERALESAIWLADDFSVSEAFLLSAGIRYSLFNALGDSEVRIYEDGMPKNDDTVIDTQVYDDLESVANYSGPEFRFSARYILAEGLSVKASYNNTYQYIHTLSNNTTVSPTDTYRVSGYHLKPQQAQQYSLGIFKNFDANNVETSIEGYYKTSDNVLDFKTGANLNLNEYVETETLQGEGKAYGVEFLLKKKDGKLNGFIGYTYSRSFLKLDSEFAEEQVNDGKFFPSNYDKPHDFSMVANYKLTERFSFSANFIYQTGRPITYPTGKFTYDDADYVLYSDRNEFRIPDFYRLDLSFNMEGNHSLKKKAHYFWNFSVYNVLGRNNPYSVYFVTEDGQVEGRQSAIFGIPVPTISYNVKF